MTTQNPEMENMSSDYNLSSIWQAVELENEGVQNISVTDHVNKLENSNTKSDSFVLDMERFSHFIEKDINANSRITLQRNLSRKGSMIRGGDRKFNSTNVNERDSTILITSPTATLHGGTSSTTEKPIVVALGSTDHSVVPQIHQITITDGSSTAAAAETKLGGKRSFSFRRSPNSWVIDPRRILFFFATLSSMGTILLIYFTLSMSKLNGDGTALD
ncbi:hypothetical protein ACJIZ3_012724 [Penstemon smallii]|uniref:Transmembrane protein n=1 Tax=Penstemon smallii TaxID=265156 RepID=A0ABD3UNZ5_9LAMI